MSIAQVNSKSVKEAAQILCAGGVVAFPTETVYGLGADAYNAIAVARIFEIKNRPHFDPLIVHVADPADVERLAHISETARILMKQFWPGPLTLVLKKKPGIPDLVVSGLDTIAVRMPAHPAALDLIRAANTPVAAPSANPFGYLSPTTAVHVEEQLGSKVPMILDGGSCQTGVESTIVDLSGEVPKLLRPGGIETEAIEKLIGALGKNKASAKPSAPGQLEQHYSPRKPLRILSENEMLSHRQLTKAGLLLFREPQKMISCQSVEVLSKSGDLREAAANLFSALHRLDHSPAEIIFAEPVSEFGLGAAIMDRLCRASATFK